jgi:hypothetical protein
MWFLFKKKVDHILECGFFMDFKSYKKEKSIELLFDYPHKSTFCTSFLLIGGP